MAISEKILKAPPGAAAALDPRDHFGTILYSGTGSAQSINGGKYDACAEFNGSSSKITLANNTFTYTALTISVWVKPSGSGHRVILENYNYTGSPGSQGWLLKIDNSNNKAVFRAYNGDCGTPYPTDVSCGNVTEIYSDSAISTSDWTHIVLTMATGTNNLKMYINGSVQSTTTTLQALSYNSSVVHTSIGCLRYSGASDEQFYSGLMDHMRVYDSALSASEVTSLYNESYANSFKVNFPTGKTAKALYRFNGNADDETGVHNGTDTSITWKYGVNFTPDMTWIAERNASEARFIQDAVRGVSQTIYPNDTYQQFPESQCTTSFDVGGFTVGTSANQNTNGNTYVAWCWNAGGSSSTNNDGSVTSTVRANTDGMFSIVQHTAPSSEQNYTIGHGLGVKPSLVFLKGMQAGGRAWFVWHKDLSQESYYLYLQGIEVESGLTQDTRIWGQQTFTDEVISTRSNYTTILGENYISYCWADVDGYQKAGSYTGNGNNHGPMIETGFKPGFIMVKEATGTTNHWYMYDDKRSPTDPRNKVLTANSTDAESTNTSMGMNWYSDGFQPIDTGGGQNRSGSLYVYFAIAAPPETVTPTLTSSFKVSTYTGNGTSQVIDSVGFKPDLTWIKPRSQTGHHSLFDAVRGTSMVLTPNQNGAEIDRTSNSAGITSFNSDGFTVNDPGGVSEDYYVNQNSVTYAAWSWKAGGDAEILTGSGSNNDVIASVNDDAGFSILKYEGTGSSGMKIRHGLSAAPNMVIVKKLDANPASWAVWFDQGLTDFDWYLTLNTDDREADTLGTHFSAAPDANLLTFGTSGSGNDNNLRYVAYCWRSISGYSKFGSYTGQTAGVTVTTGFEPDFIMVKASQGSYDEHWAILDSVRGSGKVVNPSRNDAEGDSALNTFTTSSTGFSFPHQDTADAMLNENGVTYVYAAFKMN